MTKWNKKVLFLDFDGVIRVQMKEGHTIDKFEFCPERINRLVGICEHFGLKVVLSTDWRHHPDVFKFIERLIPHLHEHHKTPLCGHRWEEVLRWLDDHKDVEDYIIMDDWDVHFEDAPDYVRERLILCDHLTGASKQHFDKLLDFLS